MAGKRFAVISIGLLVWAGPGLAQNIVTRDQTLTATTLAGRERRVFTHAQWQPDCGPSAPPEITVATPPAHGAVSIRPGETTISVVRPGAVDCTGHKVPGMSVWYQPAPGFQGTDAFAYRVNNGRERVLYTATVTVK